MNPQGSSSRRAIASGVSTRDKLELISGHARDVVRIVTGWQHS
jgi:hypothetical protein